MVNETLSVAREGTHRGWEVPGCIPLQVAVGRQSLSEGVQKSTVCGHSILQQPRTLSRVRQYPWPLTGWH